MNLSQAIVAYKDRPDAVVESILSQGVSSGTQVNYAYHNVDLINWIYDREEWREELLRDCMMERLIYVEEKGNKETRATFKADMEEVNRSNDKCPIFLEKLTFNVFSHYMSTKKSKNSGGYLYDNRYGGVRSSFTNMYCMIRKTMEEGVFK